MSALLKKYSIQLPQGNEELKKDVIDLFSKKRSGHMDKWHYGGPLDSADPVNGAILWSEFSSKSDKYYLPTDEAIILEANSDIISKRVASASALIELGPGSSISVERKTSRLLDKLDISEYIAIDHSRTYLSDTCSYISRTYPTIRVQKKHKDFFRDDFQNETKKSIMVMFGNTISNLSSPRGEDNHISVLSSNLLKVRKIIKEGYFLVSHDCMRDSSKVLEPYLDPHHILFSVDVMNRIKRDVPINGGFYPSEWSYSPSWNPNISQISHNLISRATHNFDIGLRNFTIKEGEGFNLDNTYKFSCEEFVNAAQKAGFQLIETFEGPGNRVAIHLLKAV